MHLVLQLTTHALDRQKLSRDLLTVLQMLDYCRLPVFLFLILLTGSAAHHNPSENHMCISKETHL